MDGRDQDEARWYRLDDELTGEPRGLVRADGETKDADPQAAARVRDAFGRDLVARDGDIVAELGGVCFDGVCTIGPADPGHARMVLRNLGALTGLRPSPAEETDAAPGGEDAG